MANAFVKMAILGVHANNANVILMEQLMEMIAIKTLENAFVIVIG